MGKVPGRVVAVVARVAASPVEADPAAALRAVADPVEALPAVASAVVETSPLI